MLSNVILWIKMYVRESTRSKTVNEISARSTERDLAARNTRFSLDMERVKNVIPINIPRYLTYSPNSFFTDATRCTRVSVSMYVSFPRFLNAFSAWGRLGHARLAWYNRNPILSSLRLLHWQCAQARTGNNDLVHGLGSFITPLLWLR